MTGCFCGVTLGYGFIDGIMYNIGFGEKFDFQIRLNSRFKNKPKRFVNSINQEIYKMVSFKASKTFRPNHISLFKTERKLT